MARLSLLAGLAGCAGSSAQVAVETTPPECTVALRMEQAQAPSRSPTPDTPYTALSLVLLCDDRPPSISDLRTEMGACFESEIPGNAMLAATCWWAGAGGEWTVSREGMGTEGTLVVRRRESDESESAPAQPAEVLRVPIPERARLRALR